MPDELVPAADYTDIHHSDDEKRNYSSDDKDEKSGGTNTFVHTTDVDADEHLHHVQDLEKRIMDGTATDDEAMIRDNHDIAVKVLSTYDDASLPYEILPQWIFPLLGALSIVCLVNHTSPVLRNIFGGGSNNEGMGLFSWSLDWNYIGSACLYTPLVTQLNQDTGIILTYILMSAMYYGDVWRARSFPFMSQAIFDGSGAEYNQTALLTDNVFDPVKYDEIGPAWFSATNALFLIVDNLSIGAALVHAGLFYGKDLYPLVKSALNIKSIWQNGWRSFFLEEEEDASTITDEHLLQMHKSGYRNVPKYWFYIVLLGAFAMAMATNYAGHSGMPWWALIVTLIISFIFTAVYALFAGYLGFVQFVSGGTGLYQLLGSKMVPGNPVANMYFAMLGNNPQVQAIALLEDLKLGIYIKLPPRITFLYQMLGTVIGAILNYVIMLSVIDQQREALLSISGTRLWSGQNAQSYNSNAISYGALAQQMFSASSTYYMVPAALGIGCLLPVPFYILHRFYPNAGFSNVHTAIIAQYSCYMSVGVNTSVNPAMVIGVFSQWFVRKRYPRAFTKYK
ncbi:hypothetical protein QFC22_004313 [Naganishia vaughanmartiniae]|uniref:Uncharacterized protein n=1 Tax=Naganishia vaughanmartiniae TaxID=1424756 RepID=A0ACC2X123_9TREE|nr:hypothetical protein QFC22_004313 [Naganishia vaughanmartiniae]